MGGRVGGPRVRAVARAGRRVGRQRARAGCDDPHVGRKFNFLSFEHFEILNKDTPIYNL